VLRALSALTVLDGRDCSVRNCKRRFSSFERLLRVPSPLEQQRLRYVELPHMALGPVVRAALCRSAPNASLVRLT